VRAGLRPPPGWGFTEGESERDPVSSAAECASRNQSDAATTGLGSGYKVGEVKSISLVESHALVTFDVDDDIRVGDRSEAAIKTKALLGSKVLEVTPRGDGSQDGTIPLERTTSPYQLPDAIGDLSATISGLDTDQLSSSLTVLSQTFADTPPQLRSALDGVARFSQTLDERDAQLRSLLSNANKATAILAQRGDEIVSLVANTNALLVQLESQSSALDQLSSNFSALSKQMTGLIADHRGTLKPALDRLNGVLTIVDNRKTKVQEALKGLRDYATSLGGVGGIGPVLQGLPLQPAARPVRAAVRRCCVLGSRPGSQYLVAVAARRSAGRAAGHSWAAGAVPADRSGRRPEIDSARCDHRQPGRPWVWATRRAAARSHRLLSLSGAVARTATGRSAARPACRCRASTDPHTSAAAGAR
jgi:virulence factor Mce-like protein